MSDEKTIVARWADRAFKAEQLNAELLEALKAALRRIPNEHDFDHTPTDDIVREQISLVIAKAEGR